MLEGQLAGPWVEVLRRSWADTLRQTEQQHVFVDLGNVSFVDRQGRALLLHMQEEGVGLMKPSAFLREMLKRNRSIGNGHEKGG